MNTRENVRLTFDPKVEDKIQEIVETNFDLYKRITDDPDFGQTLKDFLFEDYIKRHRRAEELLKLQESKTLEFKSSLRWSLKEDRKDDRHVTHAALKTIAAFLNTEGGDLLIGVDDDRQILGIDHDRLESDDKFMRHLAQVVRNGLGDRAGTCIDPEPQIVEGKTVCLVSCQRSPEPVYLRWKGLEKGGGGRSLRSERAGHGAACREGCREVRGHPVSLKLSVSSSRPTCPFSEQLRQRLSRGQRRDRRAREVLDVPRHDVLRPARSCRSNLHGVFEVRHRKRNRVTESRGIRGRNRHEPDQLGDEVSSVGIPTLGSHDVVEVRQSVPRDERATLTMLDPLEELGGRSRMRTPIESEVDQDIRVQQHQRYLRASASYRPSARRAALNRPRQRDANEGVSSPAISLSDASMREDSETPRDCAYCLGAGNQLILHRDCQLSLHGRGVRFANTYATHRIRVVPERQPNKTRDRSCDEL